MSSNDFIIKIVLDAQSRIAPVMAAAAAEAKKLEDSFKKVDNAASGLDRKLSHLENHVAKARDTMRSLNPTLDSLDRKLKSVSETTTAINRNFGVLERNSAKAGAALGALGGIVEKLEKKLNDLDRKMTEMGAKTYSPKVDLDGDAETASKIDALSKQLLALERKRRTVRIGIEQKILDAEIAEVERKLDKLGDNGADRYVAIKVALDEESAAKAQSQFEKSLKDKEDAEYKSQRDMAKIHEQGLAENQRRTDAQYRAERDAQRTHAQALAEDARRSDAQYVAQRRAAQLQLQAIDEDNRRSRERVRQLGERASGAYAGANADRVGFSERKADRAELERTVAEIRTEASRAGINIPIGVKLSRADRAVLEAELLAIGLKREHVKVVLDYKRSEADAAASQLSNWFREKFASEAGGGGGNNLFSRGAIFQAALKSALVFAEPLLSSVTGLAGGLVGLAAAASEAAGALGGLSLAGAAQAIPALGLLGAAVQRVTAVVKVAQLAQAERDKGAQQSLAIDNARANAQDALISAHQGVANALDGVAQAERGVIDAQIQVKDAQDALNQARRDGLRTLEDLSLAERRATLDSEQSSLGLLTSTGSGLIQQDQLKAQSDRITANRQQADTGRAQAGGVDNLPAVVSAQKGVDQAVKGVERAKHALDQASQGVDNANRALDRAQRGVEQSGKKIAAAASAYEIAFGKLSAGDKVLLRSVENFRKLFGKDSEIRKLTDTIVVSFAGALDKVGKLLQDPELLSAARSLADALATSIGDLATFLTTGPMRDALIFFTKESSKNVGSVISIFENLLAIFTNVAQAASGQLGGALKGVNGFLAGIAEKTSPKNASGLRSFFADAMGPLKAFLGLGGALIGLFAALAGPGGAAKEGTSSIESLTKTIQGATKYVNENSEKVQKFFHGAMDVMSQVGRVIVAIGVVLVRTFNPESVHGFADFLIKTVLPLLAGLIKQLGDLSSLIFRIFNNDTVASIVRFVGPFLLITAGVIKLGYAFEKLKIFLTESKVALYLFELAMIPVDAAMIAMATEGTILAGVLAAISAVNPFVWAAVAAVAVYELYKHVKVFHEAVDAVLKFVEGHWQAVLVALTGPIGAAILLFVKFGPKLLSTFSHIFSDVTHFLSGIGSKIFDPLKPGFDKLKGWASDAFGFVTGKVSGILGSLGIVDSKADKAKKKADEARRQAAEAASLARELAPLDNLPRDYRPGPQDLPHGVGGVAVQSAPKRATRKKTPTDPFDILAVEESKLTPEEAKVIEKLWGDVAKSADEGTSKISKAVRDMRVAIEQTLTRLVRVAKEDFGNFWDAGRQNFAKLETSIEHSMGGISDVITKTLDDIAKAFYTGFKYIAETTNDSLKAFDVKSASKLTIQAPPTVKGKADGGWIGQMGERGQDQIHTVLGRGEAVLNSTQQFMVNAAMSGRDSLDSIFSRTRGYHAGGADQPGYAGGGFTGPHGSLAGLTPLANFAKARFGLQVTAGRDDHSRLTSGGNVSDHSWGGAIDESNGTQDTPQMRAFFNFLHAKLPNVIKQVIHDHELFNTGGTIVPYAANDHFNHVHVALQEQYANNPALMAKILSRAGKGLSVFDLLAGASEGIADHVDKPQVKGLGTFAKLASSVMSKITAAANRFIDRQAGQAGAGVEGSGGRDSAGGTFDKSDLKTLWKKNGGRSSSANIAAAIALAESAGDPNAENSIGATGLWQVLRSAHPDWDRGGNLKDPDWNAKAAVAISGNGRNWNPWTTYTGADTPGHEKTYLRFLAQGGFARMASKMGMAWGGMQAKGGDYMVDKPTMFVAGDAGPERASFTPLRAATGKKPQGGPIEILKSGLSKFLGGPLGNVEGISKIMNAVDASLETLADQIKDLISAKSNKGKARLKTKLDKLGDALDQLTSDTGPLALFEKQISDRVAKVNRNAINAQYKITKNGARRTNVTDTEVLDFQAAGLVEQRRGSLAEQRTLSNDLAQAQTGLRRARTPAQRQLFSKLIDRIKTQRATVADTLAQNAQGIVENRESRQQTRFDSFTSLADRGRTFLDRVARVNTARGNSVANLGLFDARASLARDEIGGLTAQLKGAQKSGNTKLADQIRDQIAELNVSIVELGRQKIEALIDAVNTEGDRRAASVERGAKIGELLGTQNTAAKNGSLIGIYNQQIAGLRAVDVHGNAELQNTVNDKIQDLLNSIADLTAQSLQAGIDEVNKAADRRDAALGLRNRMADLQTRVGDGLGGLRQRGAVLADQVQSTIGRRDGLIGQLGIAQAEGNAGVVASLTSSIDDLNVTIEEQRQALAENTFQIRKLSVDIINGTTSRTTGLLGSVQTIQNNIATATGASTTANTLSVLQSIATALQTAAGALTSQAQAAIGGGEFGAQGTSLLSQLIAAFQQGPGSFATTLQSLAPMIAAFESTLGPEELSAFQGIVDSLVSNTTAVTENTAQVAALNGSVTQTFASTAWQTFRQAIFDGNGGLLPQYDMSQAMSISASASTGFGATTSTSIANQMPTSQPAQYDSSIGEVNVNLTNPTETTDPEYIGKRVAWEIAGSGRM